MTSLGYPFQRHSQCHVPDVMHQLYCHGCSATVIPSQLSCPSGPVLLSYSTHPLLSFLSCLYHPSCLLWLSCPCCPAQAFLSKLSCLSIIVPSSFAPAALYLCHNLPLPHCPVLSVLFYMPCVGDTHIGAASSVEADLHFKSSTGPPKSRDTHPSSLLLEA